MSGAGARVIEAPTSGVFQNRRRPNMKLITRFELAQHSEKELSLLFRKATEALTASAPESAERRNALATIENIAREREARAPLHRP